MTTQRSHARIERSVMPSDRWYKLAAGNCGRWYSVTPSKRWWPKQQMGEIFGECGINGKLASWSDMCEQAAKI